MKTYRSVFGNDFFFRRGFVSVAGLIDIRKNCLIYSYFLTAFRIEWSNWRSRSANIRVSSSEMFPHLFLISLIEKVVFQLGYALMTR